jgi:hypothetical protein
MEKEIKLAIAKDRLNRLSNSPKNIKCPGVVRKLRRQIKNLER